MGSSRLMLLASFMLASVAEVGFVVNWWIMSSHAAAGPGIATMVWAWPLGWLTLILSALVCMWLERRMGTTENDLNQRDSASVMLLRLMSTALLLIGPGIVVFYAIVMVLTAIGVTSTQVVGS